MFSKRCNVCSFFFVYNFNVPLILTVIVLLRMTLVT